MYKSQNSVFVKCPLSRNCRKCTLYLPPWSIFKLEYNTAMKAKLYELLDEECSIIMSTVIYQRLSSPVRWLFQWEILLLLWYKKQMGLTIDQEHPQTMHNAHRACTPPIITPTNLYFFADFHIKGPARSKKQVINLVSSYTKVWRACTGTARLWRRCLRYGWEALIIITKDGRRLCILDTIVSWKAFKCPCLADITEDIQNTRF